MLLAPSAQPRRTTPPLQILKDLAKIKQQIKTEENGDVEKLDHVPHSATVKQETGLDEGEQLYGYSSSSELSELQDNGSDAAPTTLGNEEAPLAIGEPQERSKRRRNAAKTYVEPDYSSEDVAELHTGRRIVVKNTWALNDSEQSDIDSEASYTSAGEEDSSEEQSVESNFSESEGEVDSGGEHESLDEHSDPVYAAQYSRSARQLQSAAEQKEKNENNGKIPQAKLEYMITHGTRNEVQRSKPWEVIAEECGVTASLEDISESLKQAGIPNDDRLGAKPRAAPNRGQDAPSVPRSLSSQASESSTQAGGSSTIKLTARDMELVVAAFQCVKDGCKFLVDYGKLADLAGLKGPASASAAWSGVRKKLESSASSSRLTTRETELLGLALQSPKDDRIVQLDLNRFAELAGFSSASSGNTCWLVVKKKLMARASLLTHASPAAATSLEKRKRPATTIIVDDSESEDVVPTPKKRRDNVSALRKTNILPDLHPRHVHNASSRDRRINVEKSRRLTAALPSAIYPVEPEMHVSNERLASGIRRNNADEKLVHRNGGIHVGGLPGASRGPRLGNAATTINGADATISPTNDNNSETSTTSRTLTMSAMQKQKNMVWNLEAEHMLLLAIIEVRGYQMDYEAVAQRLGCTGNAVSHHIAKLRREIRGRNDPVPLVKPVTRPIKWTNRPTFTEAVVPNASHTKDTLFIKKEVAKLEANLGKDDELAPWSTEEESALERGLRRFSGPYWSDILGLFGPNGSVSNVLKDRDEAQLDNKACRMKISFLKSGVRFPFYLRMVTGGCKKKAPTAVVDDGEGDTGARKDDGYCKGGVAVTPDEENTPLRFENAGEAPTAGIANATSEHAMDVGTTS